MALFKKTNAKIYSKTSQKITQDTIYWKQLGNPVLLKEFGPINSIDFSPVEPYCFAVSCSARVQIYHPITKSVHKTLSKFRENAYGGKFRSDGKLLCAGDEEAMVRLFDVATKGLLRIFKGHNSAVRKCFFTSDSTHLASFSDDKTVRLWDIPQETQVHTLSSHEDYVRAGDVSPVSPAIVLSGSYDNKVRMFDTRLSTEPVFTLDHGAPVESVLFLPTGGIFISAGGTEMRVWDAFAGGRLLARVCQHHKTITSMCLASNNTRLLSGSLDRHVKIYDVATYKVVHNIDYTNSILSIGVSRDDSVLAVGTVDGIISVKRKEIEASQLNIKKKKGRSSRYAGDRLTDGKVDQIVPLEGKMKDAKHDALLRKFQYGKALDVVLRPYISNKTPQVTVALLQELIRRKGLQNALMLKEDKSISALIRFIMRYFGDYRFTRILVDVTHILLDVFEEKSSTYSPQVFEQFKQLKTRIQVEEDLVQEMLSLSGAIRMLLAGSNSTDSPATNPSVLPLPQITPSAAAERAVNSRQ